MPVAGDNIPQITVLETHVKPGPSGVELKPNTAEINHPKLPENTIQYAQVHPLSTQYTPHYVGSVPITTPQRYSEEPVYVAGDVYNSVPGGPPSIMRHSVGSSGAQSLHPPGLVSTQGVISPGVSGRPPGIPIGISPGEIPQGVPPGVPPGLHNVHPSLSSAVPPSMPPIQYGAMYHPSYIPYVPQAAYNQVIDPHIPQNGILLHYDHFDRRPSAQGSDSNNNPQPLIAVSYEGNNPPISRGQPTDTGQPQTSYMVPYPIYDDNHDHLSHIQHQQVQQVQQVIPAIQQSGLQPNASSLYYGHTSSAKTWSPDVVQDVKRRTKSGCLTCRRRRVKCDERRPQCRNCFKSERVCVGYDTVFTRDRTLRIKELTKTRSKFKKPHTSRKTSDELVSKVDQLCSSTDIHDHAQKLLKRPGSMDLLPPLRNFDDGGISPLSDEHSSNDDGEKNITASLEARVELTSWQQVAEKFRDLLGESIDELLGSTSLYRASIHVVDHFNLSNPLLVNVASKVEAMRQLLTIVYPYFDTSELNVTELTSLEKLHTTDEYSIMRALIEAFVPDTLSRPGEIARASISVRFPDFDYIRRTEQPKRMVSSFSRIEHLAKLLYLNTRTDDIFLSNYKTFGQGSHPAHTPSTQNLDHPYNSLEALKKALCYMLDGIAYAHGNLLTDKIWDLVEISLKLSAFKLSDEDAEEVSSKVNAVEKATAMATSANPLGVVTLLALSSCGSKPAKAALRTLEVPQGLASAILEIALMEKSI